MERESRFTLCQWCCKYYIIPLVFSIFFFAGCSNETESPTTTSTSDEQIIEASVDLTSEEFHEFRDTTFQKLQDLFASPILDEHFETLHKIRTSDLYFNFLKNAYPNVLPRQNFRAFVENIPPNAKVYTPILKKYFGNATTEDIFVAYHLHKTFQSTRILIYHGTDRLKAEEEVLLPAFQKAPIFEWVEKRWHRDENVFTAFDADLQQLSSTLR